MWNFPSILAHRGGGTLAPENTMAALRCGHAHGFRAVEFDVMALSDGSLVLMHDEELGRTVQGQGSVADCSLAQLTSSDAGSWFSAAFAGEAVPPFMQAAEFCVQYGMQMNVEIKPVPGREVDTGRLVAQACMALPVGSVLLSSFSVEALRAARAAAPQLARGLLVEAVPADWRAQLEALGAIALHAKASLLTAEQAAAVKAAGFGLMVYTVNDPAQARELFSNGVDAICTDRLDLIGPEFR